MEVLDLINSTVLYPEIEKNKRELLGKCLQYVLGVDDDV